MIRWGTSYLLGLLWLIIPIAWFILWRLRRRDKLLKQLVNPDILPIMAPYRKRVRARTKAIYWVLALGFCMLALARPQWGFHYQEVKRRGLDIMVVLDTSKSMMAEDIKPNRLQQAKWGVRDLLQKLRGDRIGLVTFAGTSFLQCPLTIDYAAFLMTLDDVYAGILPRGGTAISKALQEAIDSFEYDTKADRAIILVTDGEDHEGDPTRLIDELKKKNIRVYAVGVGTLQGELIPSSDNQGHLTFVKDQEGKVVKTALQEDALQKVALETDGIYVRSAPGDFGLERIYDQGIDQLQRDEQESRMVKEYEERFMWFIACALLMLLIESLLSDRTRKPQHLPTVEEA